MLLLWVKCGLISGSIMGALWGLLFLMQMLDIRVWLLCVAFGAVPGAIGGFLVGAFTDGREPLLQKVTIAVGFGAILGGIIAYPFGLAAPLVLTGVVAALLALAPVIRWSPTE